ncbi:MAG: hypothetical protein ACOCO9_00215 [Segatella copri]
MIYFKFVGCAGEVIPAIDVDPEQSTHDIQQWIGNYPSLHEKVLMLMEAQ